MELLEKLIKERKQKEEKRKKPIDPEVKKKRLKSWTSFYRRNINLYASHRLQIKLHPFQHIMLYLMGVSQVFFAICSRGASKSFLVALYGICKALLNPYSEIHITATTINQAKKMVKNKMENELCKKLSPILKYFYENGMIKFSYGKDEIRVDFPFNGSTIWVDPADEQSRGGRSTLNIYEECRLLKKGTIDSVFEKMAHPRQAMFMNDAKYSGDERWIEECQSVYITSARFKNEWFWNTFKTVVTEFFNNKRIAYNFFASDIFLSITYGLKTKADYYKARKTSSESDFQMEDLNIMIGEAENAFFTRDMFKKNQVVKKAWTYPTIEDIVNSTNLKNREKQNNEYRLLWIDYAFSNTTSQEENDNSVIGCLSLIYEDGKMKRLNDFITTHSASDSFGMEQKIREMFWWYKCDYVVLDLRNGGELAYNNLTKEWKHPQLSDNQWNPHGFTVCNEMDLQVVPQNKIDDLKARTVDQQAIPCIIPIVGTAELNSIMWLDLQSRLRNEEISVLIEDIDFERNFEETKEYYTLSIEDKTIIRLPFVQSMELIKEATNLSQEWREGKVKLSEPRSGTKDRIVALSYGNYIGTLIQNKLDKNNNNSNDIDLSEWEWLKG